jgi:hypothetical protein
LQHGERSVAGHDRAAGAGGGTKIQSLRPHCGIALKSNAGQIRIIQILGKSAAHSS